MNEGTSSNSNLLSSEDSVQSRERAELSTSKHRFRFDANNDINLLRQVIEARPFSSKYACLLVSLEIKITYLNSINLLVVSEK